ncbi:hypothetical protein ACMAY4_10865 [Porticoccaceae bacterium nBUS_17]
MAKLSGYRVGMKLVNGAIREVGRANREYERRLREEEREEARIHRELERQQRQAEREEARVDREFERQQRQAERDAFEKRSIERKALREIIVNQELK